MFTGKMTGLVQAAQDLLEIYLEHSSQVKDAHVNWTKLQHELEKEGAKVGTYYEVWFDTKLRKLVEHSSPSDWRYLEKQGYVFVGHRPRKSGE